MKKPIERTIQERQRLLLRALKLKVGDKLTTTYYNIRGWRTKFNDRPVRFTPYHYIIEEDEKGFMRLHRFYVAKDGSESLDEYSGGLSFYALVSYDWTLFKDAKFKQPVTKYYTCKTSELKNKIREELGLPPVPVDPIY